MGALWEEREGRALLGTQKDIYRKALETGISIHRGPVEEPGEEVRLPGTVTE